MTSKYSDDDLVILAKAYEDSARNHMQEANTDNSVLWERYRRDPYGDEIENRSDYVAGDVCGVVDITYADLSRLFRDGGKIAQFTAKVAGEEAEQNAKQETEYANAVFLRDNDGALILRNYLMNGLVGKRGYLAVYWEGLQKGDTVKVTGISPEIAQKYLENTSIEIDIESVEYAEDGTLDFEYAQINFEGALRIEAPNPKNVLVSKGFETEDEADYVALERDVNRSDLIKQFPDKKTEIEELGDDEQDSPSERDELTGVQSEFINSTKKFTLMDEYIRVDMDGDGINELVNIKRVNELILSRDEVDMQPLSSWSSRPEPDKYHASSLAENAEQSQRVRTVAKRSAIDSVKAATMPRVIADPEKVNMNDLLNLDMGAVIRVEAGGNVSDLVKTFTTPDVSGAAINLSNEEERERQFVTGINSESSLDPKALTDTFGGLQLLQNSASARKEPIAEEAARGIEQCFAKISALLRRHHNYKRELKVKTGWVTFEPTTWLDASAIEVDIGVGTGSREAALGRLSIIEETMKTIVEGEVPGIIDPVKVYNLAIRKCEVAGIRAHEKYFNDPSQPPEGQEQQQPEQEAPDADMVKAEIDAQSKQADFSLKERAQKFNEDLAVKKVQMDEERMAREYNLAVESKKAEVALAQNKNDNVHELAKLRPGGALNK